MNRVTARLQKKLCVHVWDSAAAHSHTTHSLHHSSQHHTCHLSILFFPSIHHRSPLPSLHLNLRHLSLYSAVFSPPVCLCFSRSIHSGYAWKTFSTEFTKILVVSIMLARKCLFLKAGCQETFYNLKLGSCCLSAVLNDALQRLFVCFHKNVWIRPATSSVTTC